MALILIWVWIKKRENLSETVQSFTQCIRYKKKLRYIYNS